MEKKSPPSGHPLHYAGALALLLIVVVGVGGFAIGGQLIGNRFGSGVFAAFLLDLVFLACALIVIFSIVGWQRAHGETLRDLGWRLPTRKAAVIVAILYGLLWTATAYERGGSILAFTWERPIMILIGPVLAFAEELAVRGFFLEQLRRAGVSTWLQIVSSGILMGFYHGILGFHYSLEYAISSAILFGILSLIFVWGKRSLTPSYVAHSMVHVLGDPSLTRGILIGLLAAH